VGSATSRGAGGTAPEPLGVSAQLAEARARLRAVTPPAAWEAVLEEVRRVRAQHPVTLLAAMRSVHDRVAAGWLPPR
jgi:N-formylglutamate amidohydrolase